MLSMLRPPSMYVMRVCNELLGKMGMPLLNSFCLERLWKNRQPAQHISQHYCLTVRASNKFLTFFIARLCSAAIIPIIFVYKSHPFPKRTQTKPANVAKDSYISCNVSGGGLATILWRFNFSDNVRVCLVSSSACSSSSF